MQLVANEDLGTLVFDTNSETQGKVSVPLIGTQRSEIEVFPENINFGAIEIGSEVTNSNPHRSGVQSPQDYEHCDRPFAPNNEQFVLHDLPDLTEPLSLQPGQTAEFFVSYKPQGRGSCHSIVIQNNDADEG